MGFKASLSEGVAFLAWLSVLVESWLLVMRVIPSDMLSWIIWAFFVVIAIGASAVASLEPKQGG